MVFTRTGSWMLNQSGIEAVSFQLSAYSFRLTSCGSAISAALAEPCRRSQTASHRPEPSSEVNGEQLCQNPLEEHRGRQ
jgi:hypothetical protein